MTLQWVRNGKPTAEAPPDPGNGTAVLGVGAQNGRSEESNRQGALGNTTYSGDGHASTVVPFRPRWNVLLVEFAVTHWRVSGIHASSGRRELLFLPPVIEPILAYARWARRVHGVRTVFAQDAAGWASELREGVR